MDDLPRCRREDSNLCHRSSQNRVPVRGTAASDRTSIRDGNCTHAPGVKSRMSWLLDDTDSIHLIHLTSPQWRELNPTFVRAYERMHGRVEATHHRFTGSTAREQRRIRGGNCTHVPSVESRRVLATRRHGQICDLTTRRAEPATSATLRARPASGLRSVGKGSEVGVVLTV